MAVKFKLNTSDGDPVYQSDDLNGAPLNVAVGGTGASTQAGVSASLLIPYLLQKSSVPVSSSNDTNETAFASVSVAANALGSNGQLVVNTSWTFSGTGANKTMRVRYNGISGVAFLSSLQNATVVTGVQASTTIGQNNSTFSQVGSSMIVNSAGTSAINQQSATAAADTAAATSIVITGTKGTGTDTLTLNHYTVELLYGA